MTAVLVDHDRTATVRAASLNLTGLTLAQIGAATASTVFDEASPVVVGFGRQLFCAIAFLLIARPSWRGHSRTAWALVAAYGINMSMMNLNLYEAIKRLPLSTAVTIELLGPIGLAVVLSRGARQLAWAALAVVGVGLVRGAGFDGAEGVGLVCALIAAAGWAFYILLTKQLGRHFAAIDGLALGMPISALVSFPFAINAGIGALGDLSISARVVVAGTFSSLIPMMLDSRAMRVLPSRVTGVIAGFAPVIAALVGAVFLGQQILGRQALGMMLVVAAAAGVVLGARPDKAPVDALAAG